MGQKLKMRLGCWAGNQQHQGIGYLPDVRSIELQPWHETHVQSANAFQNVHPGVGNGDAEAQCSRSRQFPPHQGGAVVGWTSAIGAYGPFTIGMLLAECGAGVMFGVSTLIFVAILAINIYYYDRKNAPDLC